jgi:uncharacterized RDD family membrane protein YckC
MSCPICGELCRCAEPRSYKSTNDSHTTTLTEIDPYDDSEEQFSSSVAGTQLESEPEEQLASGSLAAARERYAALRPKMTEPVSPTPEQDDPEAWRSEIHSRVQSYKAKRQRDDHSMSFNFESTAANHVFLRPENEPDEDPIFQEPEATPTYYSGATAPVLDEPTEPMVQPEPDTQQSFVEFTEPVVKPAPAPETAKLIVFPRPPIMMEPSRDELAEPVFDTPRILDAPEAEAVAIPLADITLQPDIPEDLCEPHAEPDLDLMFRVAPMAQRIAAEVLDMLLVAVGTAMFGIIVARLDGSLLLHEKRAIFGVLLMVPATLWGIYKYLFLVYNGATIGMRMSRLRLVDFNGYEPRRNARRFRALGMLVSIFPLGLGLLWSFVDSETLCWHDRISRTYLTPK